jgi:hypothetical protein
MTSRSLVSAALATILAASSQCGKAAEEAAAKPDAEKYTLRYQFHPGETLRWNVAHRCQIRTSISGTTQTAETLTNSVKVWRVREVRPDGTATFEHMVESVQMRHKLSGRDEVRYDSGKLSKSENDELRRAAEHEKKPDEVRYDSRTDKQAPRGFAHVAQAVGVPLSTITLDTKGKVVQRKRHPVKGASAAEGEMTIPLPEGPIPVGHQWTSSHDIEAPLPSGAVQRLKTRQTFTLLGVKTGVATIRVATQILTPINDPAVESLVLQYGSSGTVRFDLDAGRVLGQQMDVDKGVVGFRGEASSIRYVSRFSEEFQPAEARVAGRATAQN